jgi:hypothetical protein
MLDVGWERPLDAILSWADRLSAGPRAEPPAEEQAEERAEPLPRG